MVFSTAKLEGCVMMLKKGLSFAILMVFLGIGFVFMKYIEFFGALAFVIFMALAALFATPIGWIIGAGITLALLMRYNARLQR